MQKLQEMTIQQTHMQQETERGSDLHNPLKRRYQMVFEGVGWLSSTLQPELDKKRATQ